MAKNLVIVESPYKSKTIEKYLGKDYTVASSVGHVRDLTTKGYGGFGVDVDDNFKPMYKILKDKSQIVRNLKKEIKNVDKVYLATDPDREGEAISWHLYSVLELENKDYERIVFHEVTKNAVLESLKNGRDIDIDLVRSQESRRILDRIIGFSLSKLLQRKIGSKSAGRVQSVVLKLICDREREIEKFNADEYWEIFIEFSKRNRKLKAKLISHIEDGKAVTVKLTSKQEADKVLSELIEDYKIIDINKKIREKKAKEPFITSTLQQEASNRLGFNSKKTMMVAQRLYEGIDLKDERIGLITYMRTDSYRLSDEFIKDGQKAIVNMFGSEYYQGYVNVKKSKNSQEAHEAIRPSRASYTPDSIKDYLTNDEYKLYSLIYSRALASLMKNATVEDEKVKIGNNDYIFELSGEKIIFDGYLKLYEKYEGDSAKVLPQFELQEVIKDCDVSAEQKFTNPPARYTEGRLIKKLEELGIGRPSTYATIVDTLKQRNYVKLEKKAFYPTKQGLLTSDKLDEYFNKVINVKYTADMEEILDKISEGEVVWHQEIRKFFDDFIPLVKEADEKMEKIYPIFLEETCPNCGKPLVIRTSRFGQFAACSGYPQCKYIPKKEAPVDVETGVKCPNCEEGMIVERVSKRGRTKGQKFYACNQYPKCKSTYSNLEEIK